MHMEKSRDYFTGSWKKVEFLPGFLPIEFGKFLLILLLYPTVAPAETVCLWKQRALIPGEEGISEFGRGGVTGIIRLF